MRGTPLDLFGHTTIRRLERELVGEYQEAMLRALASVGADDLAVLEFAELPDMVRGYEDTKLANVAAYRQRQRELLASLGTAITAANSWRRPRLPACRAAPGSTRSGHP